MLFRSLVNIVSKSIQNNTNFQEWKQNSHKVEAKQNIHYSNTYSTKKEKFNTWLNEAKQHLNEFKEQKYSSNKLQPIGQSVLSILNNDIEILAGYDGGIIASSIYNANLDVIGNSIHTTDGNTDLGYGIHIDNVNTDYNTGDEYTRIKIDMNTVNCNSSEGIFVGNIYSPNEIGRAHV